MARDDVRGDPKASGGDGDGCHEQRAMILFWRGVNKRVKEGPRVKE